MTSLEKEAKLAAVAELKRMSAQTQLADLEDKIKLQKISEQEQENKVRDLELKAAAES
jgi:hypothetical protein